MRSLLVFRPLYALYDVPITSECSIFSSHIHSTAYSYEHTIISRVMLNNSSPSRSLLKVCRPRITRVKFRRRI